MRNVKKLLVPIDFSPESANALRYAASLAKEIEAEVIALHIFEDSLEDEGLLLFVVPPEIWPFAEVKGSAHPLDNLLKERALDLWHFVDQAVDDKNHAEIRRVVRLGKTSKEIAAVARQENIDFVVLELRKRWLLPGMAASRLFKIVARLPYPVLLAPPVDQEKTSRGKPVLAPFQLYPSENPA